MNSREYWGLAEAYAKVYSPQEESFDEGILDIFKSQQQKDLERRAAELRSTSQREKADRAAGRASTNPATGLRYTRPTKNTTRQEGQPAVLGGRNVQWAVDKAGKGKWVDADREGLGPAAKPKPAPTPAAKPAPTPAAKPAPTPAAKPAPTPAAKSTPTVKPSTTSIKPKTPNPLLTDKSIERMQQASQMRQKGANVTSDMISDKSVKVPEPKPQMSARAQALKAGGPAGSARERMLNQGVDIFDLVKGHLLDEGYADTEEAAIAIMANMSEEWREGIVEALRDIWTKPSAASQAQMQSPFAKPTPKPLPSIPSPFAKPASRDDSGRLTTYGAGGGAAAERGGQTRSQVMQQGAKNRENKRTQPVNKGPDFGR